ncbi:AsmA family protein [bacterium]|nr:MAG: AsmA family protein [bacterium]
MVDRITISEGDIVYVDQIKGSETKVSGIDFVIEDISTGRSEKDDFMQNISFNGTLGLKKLTSHAVELSDLSFQVSAQEGLYDIRELSTTLFSGKGTGEATFDITGAAPSLKIKTVITQLRLEDFFHALSEEKTMEGEIDLSLNLSMQGKNRDEAIKTLNGHISVQGEDIVNKIYDIDSILDKYRKTQSLGVLDIGAFFLAGPVGTAVTKGYDYEELYRVTGAREGILKRLVSHWKVEKGIATAEDVAIATLKNRLSAKGNMDFINEKYENVIVAVLDENGCAEVTQKIHGSLDNPQFEKTSVLISAAGSVLSIFNKAGKLIPGVKCKVFYEGSVQHPQ